MDRTLRVLGSRALDGRSAVAKQLAAWRAALVAELGGDDTLSTQTRALVEVLGPSGENSHSSAAVGRPDGQRCHPATYVKPAI